MSRSHVESSKQTWVCPATNSRIAVSQAQVGSQNHTVSARPLMSRMSQKTACLWMSHGQCINIQTHPDVTAVLLNSNVRRLWDESVAPEGTSSPSPRVNQMLIATLPTWQLEIVGWTIQPKCHNYSAELKRTATPFKKGASTSATSTSVTQIAAEPLCAHAVHVYP